MKLDPANLAAILTMAAATYLTRIAGLFLASRMRPGRIATAALDAMPVAVLAAVIAPALVKGGPVDIAAAGLTLLAALRLPLLATVAIGVVSVVVLRRLLGGLLP